MNIVVIYHKADFDGIFCYRIAKMFFDKHYPNEKVRYIGWDYGDPIPEVSKDDKIYMLDISVDGLMDHYNLNWVDHHKSAIEKYNPTTPGYRIDGVAACRLAWQYFGGINSWSGKDKPTKDDFVNRRVSEPYAVRLAGEFDIWDKRDNNTDLFQHGLRSRELTENDWSLMLQVDKKPSIGELEALMDVGHSGILNTDGTCINPVVLGLLKGGKVIQYFQERQNKSIILSSGFSIWFEGLYFLACNNARYNSLLFEAGIKPEHDALLGFNYDGQGRWKCSMYHCPTKEHHDLSLIAVKYGGGGHRGACGFKVNKLPFL